MPFSKPGQPCNISLLINIRIVVDTQRAGCQAESNDKI